MFIQLTSAHPRLSYIIQKNPATPFLRPMKCGTVFGYYTKSSVLDDPTTFNLYFTDNTSKPSFHLRQGDSAISNSSGYLNLIQYIGASVMRAILNEALKSAMSATKPHEEDVPGYLHTLTIPHLFVKSMRLTRAFQRSLCDRVTILDEACVWKSQKATVAYPLRCMRRMVFTSSTATLSELLQIASLFAFLQALANDEAMVPDESILERYVNLIVHLQLPFYARYKFAEWALFNRQLFSRFAPILETVRGDSAIQSMSLSYGGTATQRRDFLLKWIRFQRPVIDLGCGPAVNVTHLAGRSKHPYYAIDTDPKCLVAVMRRCRDRNITAVRLNGTDLSPLMACEREMWGDIEKGIVVCMESLDAWIKAYLPEAADVSGVAIHNHFDTITTISELLAVEEGTDDLSKECESHGSVTSDEIAERVDVICSEVVEHMPLNDASRLLATILSVVPAQTLIVTTPNRDFNKHYLIGEAEEPAEADPKVFECNIVEDLSEKDKKSTVWKAVKGRRHDDHHWEMNAPEFRHWISFLHSKLQHNVRQRWDYSVHGVGHSVDGVYSSQAVVFQAK